MYEREEVRMSYAYLLWATTVQILLASATMLFTPRLLRSHLCSVFSYLSLSFEIASSSRELQLCYVISFASHCLLSTSCYLQSAYVYRPRIAPVGKRFRKRFEPGRARITLQCCYGYKTETLASRRDRGLCSIPYNQPG